MINRKSRTGKFLLKIDDSPEFMWKKYKEIKPDAERVIKDSDRARRKTFDRAVNLLAYKPRSVVELRTRLMEKEWTNSEIVEELKLRKTMKSVE